jgi:hypothetical protein
MALQSMTALASITLQEATTSVSFSGIPQNYRDLVLSYAPIGTTTSETLFRMNDDTSTGISQVLMLGNASSTFANAQTNAGLTSGGPLIAGVTNGLLSFIDYSSTDKHKTILQRSGNPSSGAYAFSHRYPVTNAITSILFWPASGNFAIGSTFNLYGRIA